MPEIFNWTRRHYKWMCVLAFKKVLKSRILWNFLKLLASFQRVNDLPIQSMKIYNLALFQGQSKAISRKNKDLYVSIYYIMRTLMICTTAWTSEHQDFRLNFDDDIRCSDFQRQEKTSWIFLHWEKWVVIFTTIRKTATVQDLLYS